MTEYPLTAQLLSPLSASAAMRGIMSDRSRLQRMLDFEAALARAEAAVGVISASGSAEIAEACQAERYDLAALVEAATPSGNIATAVVNALTGEVAKRNKVAAGLVHWGATSQDVIDTALALELRAAIDALLSDLELAIKGFTTLAGRHRRTLLAARTVMQHAMPLSLGLKLAGYAAALARSRERLTRLRRDALVLQFGGAAGTLAALGPHGVGVAERLAALLDLPLPEAPWHAHRDRFAEIASNLAILAGTCGKIARDVALMMQIEVGEASEPEASRSASSTMPHKRNPTGAAAALSAAAIAPNLVATILAAQVQEHERGLGGWQTEWTTLPTLALVVSGALDAVVRIAEGLEIDAERMRANLELSGGRIMTEAVVFALAEKMGRAEAYALVQDLIRRADEERKPVRDVLAADSRVRAHLNSVEIEKLFVPLTYQGSTQFFIDRLVFATQVRAVRRSDIKPAEVKAPAAAAQPAAAASAEAPAPRVESPPPATPLPAEPVQATTAPAPSSLPPAPTLAPAPMPAPEAPLSPAAASATAPQPEQPSAPPPPLEASAPPPASAPAAAADSILAATSSLDAAPTPEPPPPPPAPSVRPYVPPEPKPRPKITLDRPPISEDTPGAFMDILSRADAEVQAAEREANKPKRP
jgi:3-carboxy-cis,cis-muconate cycloisomerase